MLVISPSNFNNCPTGFPDSDLAPHQTIFLPKTICLKGKLTSVISLLETLQLFSYLDDKVQVDVQGIKCPFRPMAACPCTL